MEIYKILDQIMAEKNLKIADVARICNLPDSTVRGIKKRKQDTVALEVAFKLSKGLNVSLERLNGMPDKMTTSIRHKEIARLTRQLLDEEEDSFKNRFIAMLADFSAEEWENLEHRLEQLYNGKHHKKKDD